MQAEGSEKGKASLREPAMGDRDQIMQKLWERW